MADGFKLTYNPKVENARLVREGIKGTGPGTKVAQGGKASTRPSVNGGWNPLKWLKGKTQAPIKTAPVKTKPPVPGKPIGLGGIEGSIAGAAVYAAGHALIPHISRAAVRGALVVTGQDTTDFDNLNAGRPVVRNVGGKSFNIATPEGLRGYQKALASGEKPSVPAEPAVKPRTGAGQNLPSEAAIDGEGPENNTVGSDADPETPGLQGSGGVEVRETPTGVKQEGKKLGVGDINGLFSSLNERGKMTAGELPAASKFFSEALVTTPQSAYQGGELEISTGDTGYEVGAPVSKGTKIDGSQVSYKDVPGYEVPETSVPMTVGRDGDDPQEGVSDKPDIAESVRTIRMHRNKRDQLEGFSTDEPFGGVSETKGNGMTAERRAAVSAFLDPNNKGYGAIRAADRAVGVFDQNGTGGMRIDDEFVQFKPGMSADARFEARGGGIQSKEDAQTFLKKYTNALSTPDTEEE